MLTKGLSRTVFVLLALLFLACAAFPLAARAEDRAAPPTPSDDDADESDDTLPFDDSADSSDDTLAVARAIFPKASTFTSLALPAGSTADAVISFYNSKPQRVHTVILIAAYLTPLHQYDQVLQNFSVVRHARKVRHAETVSFQYSFTPYALLEPADYNLVIAVYFHDSATNATRVVAAFNNTVTVEEELGTDPKTVLTYFTLLAIAAGAVYAVVRKCGIIEKIRARGETVARHRVEVGTKGEGYDPDYISPEHQRYKAAVYEANGARSPARRGAHSASPNKKKK